MLISVLDHYWCACTVAFGYAWRRMAMFSEGAQACLSGFVENNFCAFGWYFPAQFYLFHHGNSSNGRRDLHEHIQRGFSFGESRRS